MTMPQRFLRSDAAGSYNPPRLAAPTMNYIKLLNDFWQMDSEQSFGTSTTRLYFFLAQVCNQKRWENPFTLSDAQLCMALDMTANTMKKARQELADRGLVAFRGGNNGRGLATVYTLLVAQDKVSKNDTYGTVKVSDKVSENDGLPAIKVSDKVSKNDTLYIEVNSKQVKKTENEEVGPEPSSSAVVESEKKVTPQPASKASVPGTDGGRRPAAEEPAKIPFSASKYATAEGLAQLAHNLSFGKANTAYYLRQIASKAEDLPDRVEVGKDSWKVYCQNFLTNDARSKTGLVRADSLTTVSTPTEGVGNLKQRHAAQAEKSYL